MRLPVFVSVPSARSERQQATYDMIQGLLHESGLEPHTVTSASPTVGFPLRDIYTYARHCSGGLILGFEQLRVTKGIQKPDTALEQVVSDVGIPTPWNHIEAGILFGLGLPLLIFREAGLSGGVFDPGATDAFVHPMPDASSDPASVRAVIQQWLALVHHHYFRDTR